MVIKNKQKQHPRKPTYHQVYYSSLTDTKQHRQTGADTEGEALQHYAQICTLAKQFKRHRLQRRPPSEQSTTELEEHHTTNSTKLPPLPYAEMAEIARRRVTNQDHLEPNQQYSDVPGLRNVANMLDAHHCIGRQYTVQVREEFTQGIAVAASVTKQILGDEQQERDIYIDISANPSHKNCSDRRITIVRNHKELRRLNGNGEQRNKAQMESLSKTKRRRAG